MRINEATFISSVTDILKCPAPSLPEYAFIGRSNVGKSSLINMLTGRKSLAHISNTPGKTQTINHYLIDKAWYLTDLPGYGYARISKTTRQMWPAMIRNYLSGRTNLLTTFVLVDSRITPQKIDLEFINYLGENSLPLAIVFTKTEKLGKNVLASNLEDYKNQLRQTWEEVPEFIVTSAVTGAGKTQLLDYIEANNKLYQAF
jgi:GTP-binding protein